MLPILMFFLFVMPVLSKEKECDFCKLLFKNHAHLVRHFQTSHSAAVTSQSQVSVVDKDKKIYKYDFKGLVFYSYNGDYKISDPKKLEKIRESMKPWNNKKNIAKNNNLDLIKNSLITQSSLGDEILNKFYEEEKQAKLNAQLMRELMPVVAKIKTPAPKFWAVENSTDWLNKCFKNDVFLY